MKFGMVEITGVLPHSRAEKAGIKAGDILLEINAHPIVDVLDYRFRLAESAVQLKLHRGDEIVSVKIRKDTYDDIGLEFGTPLMDKKHRCENGCVFCFIDQNPSGMRETIYFKDDDSRLSFLHGNYITLTNLYEADIDRILEMHISPVNVSIHTTNPELRVAMMKNKRSGEVLGYLKKMADAGIKLRGQIVLCKGINDGAELLRSMKDLSAYYPSLDSVSIVPAGLTGHRQGLYPLEPFDAEESAKVIDMVDEMNNLLVERMFYASDEFYLKAGRELPENSYYGEYTQIENGVGMLTSFEHEFLAMFSDMTDEERVVSREISVATGAAASGMIKKLAKMLESRCENLKIHVYTVENHFFGGEVTVTGLLTGQDILNRLAGQPLGEKLYLSRSTLRAEGDLFLCGMTPDELSKSLGVDVEFVENDGAEFYCKLLGEE